MQLKKLMNILENLNKEAYFKKEKETSMNLELNNKIYKMEIIYKNNKNMYLRIKDDLKIVITAPKRTPERIITNFIANNLDFIKKILIQKEQLKTRKQDKLEYLGNLYDICKINERKIYVGETKVFVGIQANLDNWYKKKAKELFEVYYDKCFQNFKEAKQKPVLKIRKMTSKWGVCNITNNTITLNQELIKLDPKYLEYVIYHELCHLKHHDHSRNFWNLVEDYVPNYKQIRKEMKSV